RILLPLLSSLFPYTTLFRSQLGGVLLGGALEVDLGGAQVGGGADDDAHGAAVAQADDGVADEVRGDQVGADAGDDHHRVRGAGEDRKSTRLNSSHVSNSYAV